MLELWDQPCSRGTLSPIDPLTLTDNLLNFLVTAISVHSLSHALSDSLDAQ